MRLPGSVLALCLVAVAALAPAQDGGLASLRLVPQAFWRDMASVQDFARGAWSPLVVAAAPAGWVIATVVPEEGSGAGGETLIVDGREVDAMGFAGEARIAHRFDPAAAATGAEPRPYRWQVAVDGPLDDLRAHWVFVAKHGGLVCARLGDAAAGAHFHEVILAPDGWSGEQLIAAVGRVAPRAGRPWAETQAPADLLALTGDGNPWLAIAALRAALGRVPAADLLALLDRRRADAAAEDRGQDVLQATLLAALIMQPSLAAERGAIVARLGRLVGQARSAAELRGLLLAVRALELMVQGPDAHAPALEIVRELAGMLRFRQQSEFADERGLDLLRRLVPPQAPPRRLAPAGREDPLRAEVRRDLAALQTVAAWPLAATAASELVLQITPDPDEGGRQQERAYRREEDGTIVPLGRRMLDQIKARVAVREHLAGAQPDAQEWTEAWRDVRPAGSEPPSAPAVAFTAGGLALAGFSAAQQGGARYPSLLLIPEAWAAGAGPASRTAAAHPEWFAPATAPAHRADLAGLMAGANEILVLRAGLLLIDHQAWEDDFVEVYILPRQGLCQAMILLRMLMLADGPRLAALDAGMRAFIARTDDPAALYGPALVVHAVQHGLVPLADPGRAAARLAADAWWVELLRKHLLPDEAPARARQVALLLRGS
jgi:hypothetical protein